MLILTRHTRRAKNFKNDSNDTKEIKPQFGNISEELFLISFIVLSSGLIFTDAYYQRFGFRYQTLNLSTLHVIYKGLTMVFTSALMLIPYFLTVALVIFEYFAIAKRFTVFLSWRIPIVYSFIIFILLIVFPLAKYAGKKQALSDMYENTSGFPKVKVLKSEEMIIEYPDKHNYVLFMVDDNFVVFFEPLKQDEVAVYPIIKRVSKSSITILDTYF